MFDTQKIVDTLADALEQSSEALALLCKLPELEREAIKAAAEMMLAANGIISRRLAAHCNSLMETVQ